ncbi:uncharacterized protein LOC119694884 [Plutella xylostella]|uniref:uncharacterized protein LOC119694884 n=1 Tax=Plutella xylostella TaxID=51655 RepID=UPI002032870C|nr:uncharacterized protein LOC119694884 [Plutella xylostella]
MTTKVVKCTSCKIVINEVLAFVQNKVDVMDEESLVRLCTSSFEESVIEEAKSLLFDCLDKRKTTRRRGVQFISDQHDGFVQKTDSISHDFKRLNTLEAELQELQLQNKKLLADINENNQRDRMLNLEIIGIPEQPDQDLPNIIMDMVKKLGVEFNTDDIVHAHRVTPKVAVQGRHRVIIAKLKSRLLKDVIVSNSRKARLCTKDIGIQGQPKPIYINDHLTPYNKLLLKKCKEAASKKQYQFVWAKNGIIRVLKNKTSPPITIQVEEDLKRLN